jgi:hypothetical protein
MSTDLVPVTGDQAFDGTSVQRKVRNGRGEYTTTLAGAERDAEAARLRSRGKLLREIKVELGYSSEGRVHDAIKRAFERVSERSVGELRKQQQAMLDDLKAKALAIAERQHIAHSNGRTVRVCEGDHPGCTRTGPYDDSCYGIVVRDDGPKLTAINTLRGLMEREAKLHGLDAPVKVEQTGTGLTITVVGVNMDDV